MSENINYEEQKILFLKGDKIFATLLTIDFIISVVYYIFSVILGLSSNIFSLIIYTLTRYYLYKGINWLRYLFVFNVLIEFILVIYFYSNHSTLLYAEMGNLINFIWFSSILSVLYRIGILICIFFYKPIVFNLQVKRGDCFFPTENL